MLERRKERSLKKKTFIMQRISLKNAPSVIDVKTNSRENITCTARESNPGRKNGNLT